KLEAFWRPFRPGLRRLRQRRPIERVIYLDRVEALGVVSEFVELLFCARNRLPLLHWIKDAGPGAVTGSRVIPTAGSDANMMGAGHELFSGKASATTNREIDVRPKKRERTGGPL